MSINEKKASDKASELAIKYASLYGGKVEIAPKVPVRDLSDFSVWYTPGVAAVSSAIHKDKSLSFEYTGRWNTIAIITDGSRVLGLGDIGPEAATPVMEGKSLIFKFLGGIDAVPLSIGVHKIDEIIQFVQAVEPAFAGINLEDISSPKCFEILDTLRKSLDIPVWHDDQQGTAGVTLAGLINALKVTGRPLRGTQIVLYGAGAANIATARLLIVAGCDPGDILLVDSKGILHPERDDIDVLSIRHKAKYELAIKTNVNRKSGGLSEALKGAEVLIAASHPGPNAFDKGLIQTMDKDPIVFLLANPVPELWPSEAEQNGAKVVATGRSDFPNQVNNSLLFPAIFRGVLDVRARSITDEMVIAAAEEIAKFAEETGLSSTHILPTMLDLEVYARVSAKVGEKAIELGLARKNLSGEELKLTASRIISRSRKFMSSMIESKFIQVPDSS